MPTFARIPLCVPPWETRQALEAGAFVDEANKLSVRSDSLLDSVWEWLPRRYQTPAGRPVLLPEMLPVTTWEQNVRTRLTPEVWDRMRRHAYQAAGYRCRICGADGRLEAHEDWRLVNETCVQELAGILALCPLCHKVHHLGIARRLGMLSEVRTHMMRINGWSTAALDAAIAEAYEVWEQRCDWPWQVDLGWLMRSGYLFV